MLPKLAAILTWFSVTFFAIFCNLYLLNAFQILKNKSILASKPPMRRVSVQSWAQIEGSGKVMGTSIEADDGRVLLLQRFMMDSVLEPYSDLMVTLADEYGIDYRLLPAIAMCESNLGKRIPSSDSFNAWGIAVYTGQQFGATFPNWPAAIQWTYQFVADRFVSKNITNLVDMGAIWAPPSVEKGHSWANCVDSFMTTIE